MPNRVELARPFAVVDKRGQMRVMYQTQDEADATARLWDTLEGDALDAPHTVVRLTAERVEEPIPEAKSGWEWRVGSTLDGGQSLQNRPGGEWLHFIYLPDSAWRKYVPPCDHAHVAALLKREGVE